MKLISLHFDGVFCGWVDPKYKTFFIAQGYDIVSWHKWQPL